MTQNRMQKAKLEDVANVTDHHFFPISKPAINIGRSLTNDLVIKKSTVSSRHAIIEQKPDGYFIVDLNSSNKTLLNRSKLNPNSPYRLSDGDEIRFDTFTFIFKLEEVEPPPPPPPPPPAPDHDETIFLDSGSLMDEAKEAEPPQPAPDHDETIFFDSGSLVDEAGEEEFAPIGRGRDPREAAVDKPPTEDDETTVRRKKPPTTPEITKIGNYEVIKLLGKGGFGSVWKAKTTEGRTVAIKVLNPDILEDDRAVRKFFHEAINLSKMDHPNICQFIDFFPQEGNYAIVMDFVQGTDLKDLLKEQNGPLPFDTARRIAAQSLDAFHYAHQKQVLHRDIKPENITLTTDGTVKVMDFGIARLSSTESQQTSLYMISPAYTAPERFDASKTDTVDHRSDIYSLGLVFYEIFAGKHPFPTDNPTEMIISHLSKVPEPPDQIVDLPREISGGILKALEKDPEDRFKDFAAFKMEMLGEEPLRVAKSIGPLEFSGEHCKDSAGFLKALSGIVKKHQKTAKKITLGQVGTHVDVIIETVGGTTIRITRNI
jgi:pSer/pThr/pTyr-binding forkhead associated (FHA) protein/predicted Ser/Thr protein kinase